MDCAERARADAEEHEGDDDRASHGYSYGLNHGASAIQFQGSLDTAPLNLEPIPGQLTANGPCLL